MEGIRWSALGCTLHLDCLTQPLERNPDNGRSEAPHQEVFWKKKLKPTLLCLKRGSCCHSSAQNRAYLPLSTHCSVHTKDYYRLKDSKGFQTWEAAAAGCSAARPLGPLLPRGLCSAASRPTRALPTTSAAPKPGRRAV